MTGIDLDDLLVSDPRTPGDPGDQFYRGLRPNPGAIEAVSCLAYRDDITYLTRRPQRYDAVTIEWLVEHGFPPGDLASGVTILTDAVKNLDFVLVGSARAARELLDHGYQDVGLVGHARVHGAQAYPDWDTVVAELG